MSVTYDNAINNKQSLGVPELHVYFPGVYCSGGGGGAKGGSRVFMRFGA